MESLQPRVDSSSSSDDLDEASQAPVPASMTSAASELATAAAVSSSVSHGTDWILIKDDPIELFCRFWIIIYAYSTLRNVSAKWHYLS